MNRAPRRRHHAGRPAAAAPRARARCRLTTPATCTATCPRRAGEEHGPSNGATAMRSCVAPAGVPLLHPWANRLAAFACRDGRLTAASRVLRPKSSPADPGARTRRGAGARLSSVAELDWAAPRGSDRRLDGRVSRSRPPRGRAARPAAHRAHLGDRERRGRGHRSRSASSLLEHLGHRTATNCSSCAGPATRSRLAPGEERLGCRAGERTPLPAERAPLGDRAFDDLFAVGDAPTAFAVTASPGANCASELGAPATRTPRCSRPRTRTSSASSR